MLRFVFQFSYKPWAPARVDKNKRAPKSANRLQCNYSDDISKTFALFELKQNLILNEMWHHVLRMTFYQLFHIVDVYCHSPNLSLYFCWTVFRCMINLPNISRIVSIVFLIFPFDWSRVTSSRFWLVHFWTLFIFFDFDETSNSKVRQIL